PGAGTPVSRAPVWRCSRDPRCVAATCGTSWRASAGSARRWAISPIGGGRALSPPSRAAEPGARSEVPSPVSADAPEHRNLGTRRHELLSGDRLEGADIDVCRFGDDLARDRRDRVAIGVAARRHPAAQKILVEAVGRLAGGEAARVAFGEPIAAAV